VAWYDNIKLYAMVGVGIDHTSIYAPSCLLKGNPPIIIDTREQYISWAAAVLTPIMPMFFLTAGLVSKPDSSRRAFLSNVVGLLLPSVLGSCLKSIFLEMSVLDWRVGVPFVDKLVKIFGLPQVVLSESQYWFLPTLFVLRAVYLPMLGHMQTRFLIPVTFLSWFLFTMTSEGKSVSDGNLAASAGFLSSSMIYLPYFIAGFLFKKHSTLQNFVQLAQTNKLVMWVPRILALVWLITMLALAISHDAHPADVFGIHAEGCNAIPTKFETLAPWPSFQRWPDFGCILLFQLYDIVTMVAIMLLLPYRRLPFFTMAGRRTLSAYIFLQAAWTLIACLMRWFALLGNWHVDAYTFDNAIEGEEFSALMGYHYLPTAWFSIFLLFLPIPFTLFLCSETFEYIAAPIVTPVWAVRVLDPDTERQAEEEAAARKEQATEEGRGEAEAPSKAERHAARLRQAQHWVLTFLAGGFIWNALASNNGFYEIGGPV